MTETLLSVGLDVGTTSTQMIVSRLTLENQASAFSVPEIKIARRQILYRSPIHFTPLRSGELVDGEALRALVMAEYANAGISRKDVDTGAVIITGETSRKENAATVLQNLSDFAGDFVVATAGPDLESVLSAQGSGAVAFSAGTGKPVLHMDIGGGTSNLALIREGEIVATGCLNVGGRLLKFREDGALSYISPVLDGMFPFRPGEKPPRDALEALADTLVSALEMAAGLRPKTHLLEAFSTKEAQPFSLWEAIPGETVFSFSGGVADCIEECHPDLAFGDLGPILGRAIKASRLCKGRYRLGDETIRATVIGAGCHAAQLSGSTVFHRSISFPLKNLPVVTRMEALSALDTPGIWAMPGSAPMGYRQVAALADQIAATFPPGPIMVAPEADLAKALGYALALRVPKERPILCIDRVRLREGDFLDVGNPVSAAIPVVVKTLIFHH